MGVDGASRHVELHCYLPILLACQHVADDFRLAWREAQFFSDSGPFLVGKETISINAG